jgi:hypothetical protein
MQYNKALDYTVLALDSLRQGKPVLAARLLAKAGEQTDLTAAIQILEHSNKAAHAAELKAKLAAKATTPATRLKASEECVAEEVPAPAVEEAPAPEAVEEVAAVEVDEFEGDPLDEVDPVVEEEPEPAPAMAMAAALKKLVRKTK